MKQFTLLTVALVTIMMASNNVSAQRYVRGGREMHFGNNGNIQMSGGDFRERNQSYGHRENNYDNRGDRRKYNDNRNYHRSQLDSRGYAHGWKGRVRHENGRWGYYRDKRWYWYNRYFEPSYYYERPLNYFNDNYYIADGGYLPGWEGRVVYRSGRWGYNRDNNWYWYNRYYEPDYYYSTPIQHFSAYRCSIDGRIAAGVAGGVVLGAIIGALCR